MRDDGGNSGEREDGYIVLVMVVLVMSTIHCIASGHPFHTILQ